MTSLSNIIVKGIFPVNNKLMFGSALYLFMPQFQFSLMKKIKIECPGHSLTPPSLPTRLEVLLNIRLVLEIQKIFPAWI